MGAPLQATITDQDGNEQEIDAHDLVSQLQAKGVPATGYTADGANIKVMHPQKGEIQVPLEDALTSLGYSPSDIHPADGSIDDDNVNLGYRIGIKYLGDDDAKKAYLQAKLAKDEGMPNAKVIGSGKSFHVYDPKTGNYRALTSSRGMDMADAADYGLDAIQGAATLGGAVVGGPVGAGIDSALSEGLTRGAIAAMDPEMAAQTSAEEQLGGAALTGVGAGVGDYALGKLGGAATGLWKKARGALGLGTEEGAAAKFLDNSAVERRKSLG